MSTKHYVVKKQSKKDSVNKLVAFVVLFAVSLGGLIGLLSFLFNSSAPSGSENVLGSEVRGEEISQISAPGGDDDARLKAVESVVAALKASIVVPNGSPSDPLARMEMVDKGDYSALDKDSIDKYVYLSDDAKAKGLEGTSYSALVAMAYAITRDGDEIKVPNDGLDKVYVDAKTGRAFVPVSLLSPNGAVFSVELVYVNNTWKIDPYTLLEQVKFSTAYQMMQKQGS